MVNFNIIATGAWLVAAAANTFAFNWVAVFGCVGAAFANYELYQLRRPD